jgi:hypothetical protein
MDREELNIFLSAEYAEAIRYMDNAKDALKKAGRADDRYYKDRKYVRTACGVAYSGLLVALDAWFVAKGVPTPSKKQRKSIDFYMHHLARLDKKMLSIMDTAYDVLHLSGYYDGKTSIKLIEVGFDAASVIIEKIKPENPVETAETGRNRVKRVWNNTLMFVAGMLR